VAIYSESPQKYVNAIRTSGITIYDPIQAGYPTLWIPTEILEVLLNNALVGISLKGLPLRTRSKVVKENICRALGYPVPASFIKTRPRFPGQDFDTYIQKSNNLQIWNEEVIPSRRYVILRVDAGDKIACIRVITGDILAALDNTGTLTQKYQARLIKSNATAELIVTQDTTNIEPLLRTENFPIQFASSPTKLPSSNLLLPIGIIFDRLKKLLGTIFPDTGYDQERNRGALLHRKVCSALGYGIYQDSGQFPDIPHQLLEVKLQTSPTIDLGLVSPDSKELLNMRDVGGRKIRHCDIRYALFFAETDGREIVLTHLYVTTGELFFSRFPQFQGKVINKKIQIPLPSDFFS
jgi:hypothetical protein